MIALSLSLSCVYVLFRLKSAMPCSDWMLQRKALHSLAEVASPRMLLWQNRLTNLFRRSSQHEVGRCTCSSTFAGLRHLGFPVQCSGTGTCKRTQVKLPMFGMARWKCAGIEN